VIQDKVSSAGNALYLYYGGGRFELLSGHWLSRMTLCGFPQSLQANAGVLSRLDHYRIVDLSNS
jgi:hypothetical protein